MRSEALRGLGMALPRHRRRALKKVPIVLVCVAAFAALYSWHRAATLHQLGSLRLDEEGGLVAALSRGVPGGEAGAAARLTQPQKLLVLLPCWRDCAQASILVVYLSTLLRQQGIPFRIYILQQSGNAAFNPGLLVDVGLQKALRVGAGLAPDYVAYQQAGLTPHVNVSYAFPSTPFLHLAAEQAGFNYMLPYDTYCGGAWLARTYLLQQVGGMPAAYVGYEGAEDDFCHRVVAATGGGAIPRPPPGRGQFTTSEDAALQELAAAHRKRNMEIFNSRWGPNATAAAQREAREDGLASLPHNWERLCTMVEQGEVHVWWRVQLDDR